MVIWCYESDGDPCGTSPGTAFGTNGIVTYEDATGVIDYQGNSLAIDSMGRTFVTGWSTANLNDMVIWCYESDGDPCGTSPGTAFGTNGIVTYEDATGVGNSLAIDSWAVPSLQGGALQT